MRLLHTSDWHLGQHFFGKQRQQEHARFLEWLQVQITAQEVDAVLVAGDVFDTTSPPSHAREAYHQFVLALHDLGTPLVILGGNHDSPAVLSETRDLLARLQTYVIPSLDRSPEEHVVVIKNRAGTPILLICAIPFIRAREVRHSLAGQEADARRHDMIQGLSEHYQAIYAAALAKREALNLPLPIVVTGHLTTVGASTSDSVREIYVGSLSAFPTNAFPPADYIALGHIHRPQKVGGLEHIRYCGSPIALGFDELNSEKQVLLVDLVAGQAPHITAIPVPIFQPMQRISSNLKSLPEALNAAANQLAPNQTLWLEVEVQGEMPSADLPARVAAMVEGKPLEILRLRRRNTVTASLTGSTLDLNDLNPEDVFSQRLAVEASLDHDERSALAQRFQQVLHNIQEGAE